MSGDGAALTLRVLSALVREDVLRIRSQGSIESRPDGWWLRAGSVAVPVAEDGFQCEYAARLPLVEIDGVDIAGLDEVLGRLADFADPQDRPGYLDFALECRQTLATMRLHSASQPAVHQRLAAEYGPDPADWTGLGASLAFDTLAAYLDHPVYPTARGRAGLEMAQLQAFAPEFHPRFELRWLAVPVDRLTVRDMSPLPAWWPSASSDCLAVPVHPLTAAEHLEALIPGSKLMAEPSLPVVPTLSMRTVAVAQDPALHLKLPLATATLGLRNRRSIKPGTLVDGAAGQRVIEAVIAEEPRFAGRILHADEQSYLHADHELVAALLRRYPAGLDAAVTVPLAALLAEAPGGRLVIDHLADRFYGGSVPKLYEALLDLLLDWQIALFGRGIALESHQQNTSLVLDRVDGRTRLRLLFKDDDGLRVNTARVGGLIGLCREFDDARILSDDDRALADLFITITGHLCTAALAFGLAAHGRMALGDSLGIVRDRLGAAHPALRAAMLEADRLPVKAMVTAGTLHTKARTGAADINKYYVSGPNYLRSLR